MHYKKPVISSILLSLIMTIPCNANIYSSFSSKLKVSNPSAIEKSNKENPNDLNKNPNNISEYTLPNSSGKVIHVPWENDPSFKKAKMDLGTDTMLAGFCTVLKDPLPGEEENVHIGARMLAGTIVQPGETFSQNNTIGPYVQSKGFKKGPTYIGSNLETTVGGGVCKIATTLYNVSILSNLPIIERHSHSMPVPYVPYGQDATVSYGSRDFKFKNNTKYPILIWSQGIDNVLFISFYGKEAPPKIDWHHETLKTEKAKKIYKLNSSLPKGTEKLILEGMDGATVKSWITIQNLDGSISKKDLGISHYNAMPHLYEQNK